MRLYKLFYVILMYHIIQEARGIPFVGDRLADKIHEIITSGHLRRLDEVDKTKQFVIDLFKAIHGVGQTTAEQFYAQVSTLLLVVICHCVC